MGPDQPSVAGIYGSCGQFCQMTLKAFRSLGTRSGQAVAIKLRKGVSTVLSQCRCDVTVRHHEAEIL